MTIGRSPLARVTRLPRVCAVAVAALVIAPIIEAKHRGQAGLTAPEAVAAAYDTALDADFARVPEVLAATCGPAPEVACQTLRAVATWWEIQLDPQSERLDTRFSGEVEAAIDGARAWTELEPNRAEAWFYLGASLGARSQWKVLREERLSAARDGKQIRAALEQALDLDPGMHDATFGVGLYRYYADIAPAYLRWLRWMFLLPGGDREEGLAQMEHAAQLGTIVRNEASYQLHVVYLWYEERFLDALRIVRSLQARYPRNPHFRHGEAEILDVYVHDAAGSLASSQLLLADAERGAVNRPDLAAVRARLNIAVQLDRLGQRDEAREALSDLLDTSPVAPIDAVRRARELRRAWAPH